MNTFDAHLVLGYTMPTVQLGAGDTVLETIPFIKYDRDYVDGAKAPKGSTDVDNFAAGLQESLTIPIPKSDFYNNMIFQPEYIRSLRSGAEVAKLYLAFQPEPLWPYFGFVAPTIVPSLSATAYARGILNIGQVTTSTTDPTLAFTRSFYQAGAQIGGGFFNKDESSVFNGISIPIEYSNLKGFYGQYRSIHLFTAAINYTLPKTKYVTIGLSYTNGRNLDTFENQQLYKATLGIKY